MNSILTAIEKVKEVTDIDNHIKSLQSDLLKVIELNEKYPGCITISDLINNICASVKIQEDKAVSLRSNLEDAEVDQFTRVHNLRNVIFELMKEKALTYKDISASIGYSTSDIEAAVKGNYSPAIYEALCDYFNLNKAMYAWYFQH